MANYVSSQGWGVGCTPKYPTMHLTIHKNNMGQVDEFVRCVGEGFRLVKKDKKAFETGPGSVVNYMKDVPNSIGLAFVKECYHEIFNIQNICQDGLTTKSK